MSSSAEFHELEGAIAREAFTNQYFNNDQGAFSRLRRVADYLFDCNYMGEMVKAMQWTDEADTTHQDNRIGDLMLIKLVDGKISESSQFVLTASGLILRGNDQGKYSALTEDEKAVLAETIRTLL